MSLAAGRLRDRVTIRRSTLAPDGHGGQVATWTDLAEDLPAEVVSQDGREAVIASALQGISTIRVTIRWRSGITSVDQMRVAGDARDWNVRSAEDPDRRRERLVILADTASAQR